MTARGTSAAAPDAMESAERQNDFVRSLRYLPLYPIHPSGKSRAVGRRRELAVQMGERRQGKFHGLFEVAQSMLRVHGQFLESLEG